MSGDLDIKAIKKSKYIEIFPYEDGQFWFKVVINLMLYDEDSGKEKISILMEVYILWKAYLQTKYSILFGITLST